MRAAKDRRQHSAWQPTMSKRPFRRFDMDVSPLAPRDGLPGLVYSRGLVLALPGGGVLMAAPLEHMLDLFGLTGGQRLAASERARNTIVTAGAGSGKTRTLVARYLGLLSEGLQPRQVVAVTFTEKAAREMRSRTREQLHQLLLKASSPLNDRAGWNWMPRWIAPGSHHPQLMC